MCQNGTSPLFQNIGFDHTSENSDESGEVINEDSIIAGQVCDHKGNA